MASMHFPNSNFLIITIGYKMIKAKYHLTAAAVNVTLSMVTALLH
jgi:hypothetical protein